MLLSLGRGRVHSIAVLAAAESSRQKTHGLAVATAARCIIKAGRAKATAR
jgi:hypothetical protein